MAAMAWKPTMAYRTLRGQERTHLLLIVDERIRRHPIPTLQEVLRANAHE